MSPRKPIGTRSSLFSHSFPAFYACYILKSVQTSRATATYIGSTPSPPRRIRQHNGEITQGAWKTRQKRPWVMQMIVHGFPSKLAALQFEWAWQHPHLSRHMRDANGKALIVSPSKTLKNSIYPKRTLITAHSVVRMMISHHPFSTWPLHIKFFTQDAVKLWNQSSKALDDLSLLLPKGFTYSIELEGVDGKSGLVGSGRKGPISVKDEIFTSSLLAKNTALVASSTALACSICKEALPNYTADPLTLGLCPSPSCKAVSHLLCLSRKFLDENGDTDIIPRGGHCTSCDEYILWGDIVRGCYRRVAGGIVSEVEEDLEESQSSSNSETDALDVFVTYPAPKKSQRKTISKVPKVSRKKCAVFKTPDSSEGEAFDFESTVSSDDIHISLKKKVRRPRKVTMLKSPKRPRLDPSKSFGSAASSKRKYTTAVKIPDAINELGSEDDLSISPRKSFKSLAHPFPLDIARARHTLQLTPNSRRQETTLASQDEILSDFESGQLSRAMSTLSVTSPSNSVIEISD